MTQPRAGTFVAFRSRSAALVDGPPIRGDSRIQLIWMVVTTVTVLFLAGFGTYELVKSGSGGGQSAVRLSYEPEYVTNTKHMEVSLCMILKSVCDD